MKDLIPIRDAVRVSFAFAVRHYPCFSLEYSDKLHDQILNKKYIGRYDIHTPIGDIFAVVCQAHGIFDDQYYDLAKEYFFNA